jgi:glucosylceramidase
MTDTSAWLLDRHLSPGQRDTVMVKLFGPTGIELNYVRVPIGASDFTAGRVPYTYDDVPPGQSDPGLTRFSIAHDQAYVLPMLRQALAINPSIQILASPWTAPAWMKANKALDNLDRRGLLLPEAYGAFARYFVKFIRAYAAAGVRVDAVTPENEPEQSTPYPGMTLPVQREADFLATALQPALHEAGLNTKVYGFDFNWFLPSYPQALVADRRLAASVSGIAWHCYAGDPNAMTSLHSAAPALEQLETECSSGLAPGPAAEMAIASTRNWATVVLLWNLALDRGGGPVQPPNMGCPGCAAPVTVDEPTSSVTYGLDYYQIGQFSSFVRRGAQRIASDHFVQYRNTFLNRSGGYATPGLDDVAFQNPDGSKVLVAVQQRAGLGAVRRDLARAVVRLHPSGRGYGDLRLAVSTGAGPTPAALRRQRAAAVDAACHA